MLKGFRASLLILVLPVLLVAGIVANVGPVSATNHDTVPVDGAATCVDPTTVEFDDFNSLETVSIDISENPIFTTFIIVVNFLSIGVGIVAAISVAFAGYQYMASRGNPGQIQAAIKRLTFVGTAIVTYVFGWALLNWLIPGGVYNTTPTTAVVTENTEVGRVNFCEVATGNPEPNIVDPGIPAHTADPTLDQISPSGSFLPSRSPPGSRASILGPVGGWKIRGDAPFVSPPFSSWSEEAGGYLNGTEIYDPNNTREMYFAAVSSVKYLRNLADEYIVNGANIPSNVPAQIDEWVSLSASEALLPRPSNPNSPQAPGFGNLAATMGGIFVAAADLEIDVPGARVWYNTSKILTDNPNWKRGHNLRLATIHMQVAAAKAGGFWDEVRNELLDDFRNFISVSFRTDGVNVPEVDRDRAVMYSTIEFVSAAEIISIFRQSGMTVPNATLTRLRIAAAWGVRHFKPAVEFQPTNGRPYTFFDGPSMKTDVGPLTWEWGGWWRWAYQVGLTDVQPPNEANPEVLWQSQVAVPDWRGASKIIPDIVPGQPQ